jgi:hypothetical protein
MLAGYHGQLAKQVRIPLRVWADNRALGREHLGKHRLCAQQCAQRVAIEAADVLSRVNVEHRRTEHRGRVADVVTHDSHEAKLGRRLKRGVDVLFFQCVHRVEAVLRAAVYGRQQSLHMVERGLAACHRCDAVTFFGEFDGDRTAKAKTTANDGDDALCSTWCRCRCR